MEAEHEATEEAGDELIAKLSPEPAMQDPSRRRTEIYIHGKAFFKTTSSYENMPTTT